jgi:hypothetical protein
MITYVGHMEDLFGLFAQIGSWPVLAPEAV